MDRTRNLTAALERIADLRLLDSIALARGRRDPALPAEWPRPPQPGCTLDRKGVASLLARFAGTSADPRELHRRALEEALAQPRVREVYFRIRRALWTWPEFLTLTRSARGILSTVIEFAREEAFPWNLFISMHEIRRFAPLAPSQYTERLRELEMCVITRPARRIRLRQSALDPPRWPSAANNFGVDPDEPLEDIPQFVVRYRRGGRGAGQRRAWWWINYDLLCGTERILPCFEFTLENLPKTWQGRNRRMGRDPGSLVTPRRGGLPMIDLSRDNARFRELERAAALHGPRAPTGLRAALWEGM